MYQRRKLNKKVVSFIKNKLADGDSYGSIVDAIMETFELKTTKTTIYYYKHAFDKEIKELTKKKGDDLLAQPLAHKSYRLLLIKEATLSALKEKKYKIVQSLLEQARIEIEGAPDSGPKNYNIINNKQMDKYTDADINAIFDEILANPENSDSQTSRIKV